VYSHNDGLDNKELRLQEGIYRLGSADEVLNEIHHEADTLHAQLWKDEPIYRLQCLQQCHCQNSIAQNSNFVL
jgi:hypothetical protein